MKLLILIHSLASGGAERIAGNMANYWHGKGDEISVVTMASLDSDYYRLDQGITRIALDMARDSRNGLEAAISNIRRIFAIRRVLISQQPDVAIAIMNTSSILLALASLRLPFARIGAEHRQPSRAPLGAAWSKLCRYSYRYLDAVVALTPESADWLRYHTLASKVPVIPNPVIWPLPEHSPRVEPYSVGDPARKRLLAVGRLARVKGFDLLLDAFAGLAKRHHEVELLILGEGSERAALQRQIEAQGLAGQVILAGRVGNLSDWYRSAHLLVMSSRHEGFPNALVEAMAHGLPAVSFDCEAGPRNIIRHEVDGLLVPPGDIAKLASAIELLIGDSDMRDRYAARAVEVRERFSEARIQDSWHQLFNEVRDARCH